MKVPKEESKEPATDNTLNEDDDDMTNPYDTESNSDSIDPPTRDGDFSEYMWMENQEEFDLQVMKELEEKELMKECLEAMLDEEHSNKSNGTTNGDAQTNGSSSSTSMMTHRLDHLSLNTSCNNGDQSRQSTSTLNPDAAEFVPLATRSLNNASVVVASPS